MAIVVVRDDRRRVVAHIRVHGERLVDVTQTRRWTFTDVRLVVAELSRLADRHEPLIGDTRYIPVAGAFGAHGDGDAVSRPPAMNPGVGERPQSLTGGATTRLDVGHDTAPPLRGPGSSRAAWLDYARAKDVPVSGTMSRDDIAAAVQDHEAALSGV